MPPPCSRCVSQRVINLETARKLGTAAGALVGFLKGAYATLYVPSRGVTAPASFPMTRIAAALVAAASGGIAGAAAGQQMVQYLFPPGEGTPWLCLGCGNCFRILD